MYAHGTGEVYARGLVRRGVRKGNGVNFFRELISGIRSAWAQLSLSARVNIALAGMAVFVVIALVAYSGARTEMVTLASGLKPEEANKVLEILRTNEIPFEISTDNATIKVPLTRRGNVQLLLAENDVALGQKNLPGFELFQTNELMSNQWLQDVKYLRAIQGELQRQLNAIDFVDASYVLIREAKDELFVDDQKPSEAAVTLKLRRPITKQEVKGIINLVAAAGGPNLSPNQITLTTTDGQVLHVPPASEFASIANSKLEYLAELESRQETRIEKSLRELGKRGTVRVSAQIDNQSKKIKDEKVTEGAELSTLTSETKNTSQEASPQGAPGAFANVPEGAAASGQATTDETTSEELSNFEPSRTMTETVSEPGDVIKYTVALIVEGDRTTTTDANGASTETYEGLSEDRKKFYSDLVKGAVGSGREDTEVTVNDYPFEVARMTEASVEQQAAVAGRLESMGMLWTGAQVALILVGFFFVRMFIRRAIEGPEDQVEVEEVAPIPEATREDLRRTEVSGEVARLSRDEPEMVVSVLRAWLIDEEE